jgi:hypothetical protein
VTIPKTEVYLTEKEARDISEEQDVEDNIETEVQNNTLDSNACVFDIDCSTNFECNQNECVQKTGCAYGTVSCAYGQECIINMCVQKQGCNYANPACESGYACIENECKLTWESRIDELSFSNYQETIQDETRTVTNGKYKIILPVSMTEQYAKYRLYNIQICSEEIEGYLGVSRPYIGTSISTQIEIGTIGGSSCCGNEENYPIMTTLTQTGVEATISENAIWKRGDVDYGICQGGHEEVHRYVHNTVIDGWANEGLAQYLQGKFQSMPGNPGVSGLVSCNDNTMTVRQFTGSGYEDVAYRNVNTEFNDYPRIHSYYTGVCFWEYIENNYGIEGVHSVIDNLYVVSSENDSADFIEDVVVPVLGNDIRNFLSIIGL